jgi:class 3 adenylate cyclase/pimeloyl-ACP methyl ester carboxylesterase
MDGRGTGASGGASSEQFVGDTYNADVLAVMDTVGSERATHVGWSAAANYTITFAAAHPERVDALVFINSCAHYVREEDYPWGYPAERLDDIAAFLQSSWDTVADVDMTAPSRTTDDHLRLVWGRSRRSGISPYEYAENLLKLFELDTRPLLPSISAWTLVLHREGDRFIHLGAGRYLAEHIPDAKFVVIPGEDHLFFVGDTDGLVDEIEEFLTGSRSGAEANVVSTTILFTDIVGSTEHQARVGAREWSRRSDDLEAMVRDALARHRGREIKSVGDGVLAIFDANGSAVRCASEIVDRARAMGLSMRAGLHTGDVEVRGGDISGLHVNIASRVCDLASPAEVLVSESVKTAVTGSGLGFTESGKYELKGVPGSWRLYRVTS